MIENALIGWIKGFNESEMRSYSMDIEDITPLYVYRMWGGSVSLGEIERAMADFRRLM